MATTNRFGAPVKMKPKVDFFGGSRPSPSLYGLYRRDSETPNHGSSVEGLRSQNQLVYAFNTPATIAPVYSNVTQSPKHLVNHDNYAFQPVIPSGNILKIYTEWANHYLEKSGRKRFIQDLQRDVQDSTLLVDVIEAVTGSKIPESKLKSKAQNQLDTLSSCFRYLEHIGVNLDGLTPKDIYDGQLKSVLGLFFSLSRYKQQQKSLQAAQNIPNSPNPIPIAQNSRLPTPGYNTPTASPSHVPKLMSGENMLAKLPSPFKSSTNNTTNSKVPSGLPQMTSPAKSKLTIAGTAGSLRPNNESPSHLPSPAKPSLKSGSGLKPPSVSSGIPPPTTTKKPIGLRPPSSATGLVKPGSLTRSQEGKSTTEGRPTEYSQSTAPASLGSKTNSQGPMLDKFKLFGSKDRAHGTAAVGGPPQAPLKPCGLPAPSVKGTKGSSLTSSRASTAASSSGFSSGRSELSSDYDSVATTSSTPTPESGSSTPVANHMAAPVSASQNAKTGIKSAFSKKSFAKASPSPKPERKPLNSVSNSPRPGRKTLGKPGLVPPTAGKSFSSGSSDRSTDSAYGGGTSSADISSPTSSTTSSMSSSGIHGSSKLPAPGSKLPAKNSRVPKSGIASGGIPKPTMVVKGTSKLPLSATSSAGSSAASSRNASNERLNTPSKLPDSSSKLRGALAAKSVARSPQHSKSASPVARESTSPKPRTGPLKVPPPSIPTHNPVSANINAQMGPPPGSPTIGVVSPMSHRHITTPPKESSPVPSTTLETNATSTRASSVTPSSHVSVGRNLIKPNCEPTVDIHSSFDSIQGGHQSDSNASQTSSSGNHSDTQSVIFNPAVGDDSGVLRRNRDMRSFRSSISPCSVSSDKSNSPARRSKVETTFECQVGVITTETSNDESPTEGALMGGIGAANVAEEGGMEDTIDIKPMDPMMRNTPTYAFIPSLGRLGTQLSNNLRLTSEPGRPSPMAQIGRANGSHYANIQLLAARDSRDGSPMMSNSGDPMSHPVAAGYLSDGDVLHSATMAGHLHGPISELEQSGYLSEGGITQYVKRMQATFKEGMAVARDSMRKPTDLMDESYEDSSSISSGISENIDEISTDDLTGSSDVDAAMKHQRSRSGVKPQHNGNAGVAGGRSSVATQSPGNYSRSTSVGHYENFNPSSVEHLLIQSRAVASGRSQSAIRTPCGLPVTSGHPATGIRVSAAQFSVANNYASINGHAYRVPLPSSNAVRLLKQRQQQTNAGKLDGTQSPIVPVAGIPRPASAAGEREDDIDYNSYNMTSNGQSSMGSMTGYHSLDRKKHLLSQFGVPTDFSLCHGSNGFTTEGGMPNGHSLNPYATTGIQSTRGMNSGTLATLSPRNTLVKNNGGLILTNNSKTNPNETNGQAGTNDCSLWGRSNFSGGSNSNSNMSRSLVEQELKQLAASSKNLAASAAEQQPPPQVHVKARPRSAAGSNNNKLKLCPTGEMTNGVPQVNGSPRHLNTMTTSNRSSASDHGYVPPSGIQRYSQGTNGEIGAEGYLAKLSNSTNGHIGGNITSTSNYSGVNVAPKGAPFASGSSPFYHSVNGRHAPSGEEIVPGSSWSLASSTNSMMSEERYQAEIRKLHREVELYRERVQTMMTQQNNYEFVVNQFESSLDVMRRRLNTLLASSEHKDQELTDLRNSMDSMTEFCSTNGIKVNSVLSPLVNRRHTSSEDQNSQAIPSLLVRQPSNESMVSLRSTMSQKSSLSSMSARSSGDKNKAKKSWPSNHKEIFQIRSSFSKAFTKKKNKNGSMSDVEEGPGGLQASALSDVSNPTSPAHTARHSVQSTTSSGGLSDGVESIEAVETLQKQLEEKDFILTDLRLEALTSAHQLDQVKEELTRYKTKMANLMHDNQRLRAVVVAHKPEGAPSHVASLPIFKDDECLSEVSVPCSLDANMVDGQEGIRIKVAVSLDLEGRVRPENIENKGKIFIGTGAISSVTRWDLMDSIVEKLFKEYVLRIDQGSNLGLSGESLLAYQVGDQWRVKGQRVPKELPAKCFTVGSGGANNSLVRISLRGARQSAADCLSFETLIPKQNMQRLLDQLLEHKRILLFGPSGSGKSILAQRLGQYLAVKACRNPNSVVTYTVADNNASASELTTYINSVAEHCDTSKESEVPLVLICDNLHLISSLSDTFSGLPAVKQNNFPFIIATMNHADHTNSLELPHSFRMIGWAVESEPVSGFLIRHLRRRLIEREVEKDVRHSRDLHRVIDWLPEVWLTVNRFLKEVTRSTVPTVGPQFFLNCPLNYDQARNWFVNVWNETVAKYLRNVINDFTQNKNGHLEPWEETDDPCYIILQSSPWLDVDIGGELDHIRYEDFVGSSHLLDTKSEGISTTVDEDPYIALMRLHHSWAMTNGNSNSKKILLTTDGMESNI